MKDIFEGSGRGAPAVYPFAGMEVNAVELLPFRETDDLKAVQRYVHSYAAKSGKKFKTRRVGSVLHVKRIS